MNQTIDDAIIKILARLHFNNCYFNELMKSANVPKATLSRKLKKAVPEWIERNVSNSKPPSVTYSITKEGEKILSEWSKDRNIDENTLEYMEKIVTNPDIQTLNHQHNWTKLLHLQKKGLIDTTKQEWVTEEGENRFRRYYASKLNAASNLSVFTEEDKKKLEEVIKSLEEGYG